ncbi:DUF4255 domain-containing protein [Azohydromonas caseinilytica]|uniref:DUF4255 domain-containing protein n=1 Tax=Azohydromonas caseinilytica TaxID=2728836 RepID=A0A848FBC9_9BURK|nr:DUF4255 domain-containing protein [Azohydromonas caseinilytica]NML16824.1 DUF4255 domain-containing protein [Azohydromonas caseinilytica]
MASPSSEAIGVLGELLARRLSTALNSLPVVIGRPEASASGQGRRLNLFLYRVTIDAHLRNVPLDAGQVPPLWVVLHYLLTAFDDARDSDSTLAHRLLGQGMAVLHELNFVRPSGTDLALLDNPEPLKLSFDDADVDLLSKLMQGSEESYRVSAALQVRPLLLKLEQPPAWAPLVRSIGPVVPQPAGPPAPAGISVLPSLGAVLGSLQPARFVAGTRVTLRGTDLAGYTEVQLGTTVLPLAPGAPGTATFTVPAASPMAAGAYPLFIARVLPSGRRITSNALLVELLPVLGSVALDGALSTPAPPAPPGRRFGRFVVNGSQLGGDDASVFASLFRNGEAHGLFEPDAGGTGTQRRFSVPAAQALPTGRYRVLLRVNGQQAIEAPELDWS